MDRVTVDVVREAVAKNEKISLKAGTWITVLGDKCVGACALSHVAMANGIDIQHARPLERAKFVRDVLGLHMDYMDGFTNGFDDCNMDIDTIPDIVKEMYNQGYADGSQCRIELLGS